MIVPCKQSIEVCDGVSVTLVFEGESTCLVKAGDTVVPKTVILEGRSSRVLQSIQLARELGVRPSDVRKFVTKSDGEIVDKGEILARRTVAMGTVERIVKAIVEGRISLSRIGSGVIDILAPFSEIDLEAGFHGKVVRIMPARQGRREVHLGVTGYVTTPFETVGGQVSGKIHLLKTGTSLYRPADVSGKTKGKIVVAGRSLSVQLYEALVSAGACGVIVGGMPLTEFRVFEEFPIPIAITEGWGVIPINAPLMEVLAENDGDMCFMDADQGRFVLCPSDAVPKSTVDKMTDPGVTLEELEEGDVVQVWDMPYWGFSGEVKNIMEDERLVRVSFDSGRTVALREGSIVIIDKV